MNTDGLQEVGRLVKGSNPTVRISFDTHCLMCLEEAQDVWQLDGPQMQFTQVL